MGRSLRRLEGFGHAHRLQPRARTVPGPRRLALNPLSATDTRAAPYRTLSSYSFVATADTPTVVSAGSPLAALWQRYGHARQT